MEQLSRAFSRAFWKGPLSGALFPIFSRRRVKSRTVFFFGVFRAFFALFFLQKKAKKSDKKEAKKQRPKVRLFTGRREKMGKNDQKCDI